MLSSGSWRRPASRSSMGAAMRSLFLVPGQERATRLRASTLGDGYDPEDIKAVIAGARPIPEQPVPVPAAPRRVNLIVDIRERLRSGKGTAYARWAKVYNLKQMAAALQFMQEQNITEYDQLSAKAEDAVSRFHALTEQLRRTEADLSVTSELMGAVVRYAKTRPVFDGYKAAKYSRKYLAEHEAELADYRAAKATMAELLGGEKLPKMAELKKNAANWRRRKRRSIPSTARRRRKCGRPWRSRPTLTICWASRTASAKGTGAIAHGDADKLLWDKMSQSWVWGGSPNKRFCSPPGCKNSKCGYTCPACR